MYQLSSVMNRLAAPSTRRTLMGFKGAFRPFHSSFAGRINAGETIPSVTVFESSPGNKLIVKDTLNGKKAVIIGVPGAFSPGCSASHVPGYIENLSKFKEKGYHNLYVVAVNDPFVTKAWKENLKAPEEIRFIADSIGEFTEQLEFSFDASAIFGNDRSKRYALLVDADGKVENLFVEPDNVGINVSRAENVLKNA